MLFFMRSILWIQLIPISFCKYLNATSLKAAFHSISVTSCKLIEVITLASKYSGQFYLVTSITERL